MNRIAELLALEADDDMLSGVEKLTANVKAGFQAAKDMHSKKEDELKAAKDKVKAAQQKATTTAIAKMKDDIDDFIAAYFAGFPTYQDDDVATLLTKYPTLEASQVASKAFYDIGARIDALRKGFNEANLRVKGRGDSVRRWRTEAAAYYKAHPHGDPSDKEFNVQFVRKEATFFKRAITIKDDFQLDAARFKELMTMKLNQTDPNDIPQAGLYVNRILVMAAADFRDHSAVISKNLERLTADKMDAEKAARAKGIEPDEDAVKEEFMNLKELLK